MFKELLERNLLLIESEKGYVSKESYSMLKYDLYQLGYKLDDKAEKTILKLTENTFSELYKNILKTLKVIKGDNVEYTFLRDDFMEKSENILIPRYEYVNPQIIKLISRKEAFELIENLITSKTNISKSDEDLILSAIKEKDFVYPTEIPNKENLAKVAKVNPENIKGYVKTATDVLRIATAFVDGDVSLSEPCKFKFTNKQRRFIVSLLEGLEKEQALEDMKRYINRWKIIARLLHTKNEKVLSMFNVLRNNPKTILTFGGKVAKLKNKELLNLLKTRPGEFARRIDALLRNSDLSSDEIIMEFNKVIGKISNPILIQLYGNFKNRNEDYRMFLPKGTASKIWVEDKIRDYLPEQLLGNMRKIIDKELSLRYEIKEGVVPEYYKNIMIPTSQRSATGNKMTRGSRIKFSENKFIRLFCYWKENETSDRVDVDLSALCLNEDFTYNSHVDYTLLDGVVGTHSGDFTSAKDGASEFIDLDIEAMIKTGGRYIAVLLYSYTGQAFTDFECFAGMMERENVSKDVFDARTVKERFDVSVSARQMIPMVFDLKERELIWTDLVMKRDGRSGFNVSNTLDTTTKAIKAITEYRERKMTMYELLSYQYNGEGKEIGEMRIDEMMKCI